MEIAKSKQIRAIDSFAERELMQSTLSLMGRSGEAVSAAVRTLVSPGSTVIILAGVGNNGGDGYAAGCKLSAEYKIRLYDLFSAGQRSDAGRAWRDKYIALGGELLCGPPDIQAIEMADCIVDAVFGTGFSGELSDELSALVSLINSLRAKVVAVDIPMGVCADTGEVDDFALSADITVALSYPKVAHYSYPARDVLGKVLVDGIGIDKSRVRENFSFSDFVLDDVSAAELLPKRKKDGNKGTFGRALLLVGSREYTGSAHLSLEAALRGGAGYVSFIGTDELCDGALLKFPEAIYERLDYKERDSAVRLSKLSAKCTAMLIGSGCGVSKELFLVVSGLIRTEGAPLVLDADSINSIARYGDASVLDGAMRTVILTPHPMEFSRISGLDPTYVQSHRYTVAQNFAKAHNCILVLKGAGTIITDGERTYINSVGTTALAKAGSGDVLSGLLTSLLSSSGDPLSLSALAVYVHARAGDILSAELSDFGVTPSDLPQTCAKVIAELSKKI